MARWWSDNCYYEVLPSESYRHRAGSSKLLRRKIADNIFYGGPLKQRAWSQALIASRKINETTKGWRLKLHSSFCMNESFEENKTIANGRTEEFEDRAMRMKSCAYCGRIHPADYVCPKKPKMKAKDNNTLAGKLRSSYRWQKLRDEVKARDKYICQCCLRNYPGTIRQVEYDGLSVHHIISIEKLAADDI